ncbi:MAG: glycosyltransferase, partial [Acidimicrobiales bacterium]
IERRVRGAARSTTRRWSRGLARPKRALFLSSPIGLGHGRRDLAIADELRRLVPDLSVEWLTQHPVSALLEARGEQVHPASGHLVSESAHLESECGEHDLHAFQALRTMDEVLVANFHVFDDLLEEEQFDLVVADEAWDVDHFLHENPELKRSPLVWLTDFVGSVPMAAGGEREAYLTADYNAEMLEHVERFGWLRDRSIFVGDPDDVVPLDFGPGLPSIRAWTNEHFDFAGYVSGFTPPDRDEARATLGWQDGEPVCVVTVGGSGVGGALLRRVLDAVPAARRAIDGLRVVIVTGPRLDPASIPATAGVEVHGFLPDLPRWLAGCDLAMVQGGLTTCMELVASQVPFVYFPLANHFEQQVHVRHRLDRYGAGRCLQYADSPPDLIGQAMVEEVGRRVEYRPVSTDGAARSARLIAELL